MIFTSDEVTSENHWRITSRVTKKSLFTETNVSFYFLHAILCSEHTIPLKTIIDRSFLHCHQNGLFWLSIVTSPQLIYEVTRTSIVTAYSSIVLARANWCKCDLHWWLTAMNVDFSPLRIHGLACKNICLYLIFKFMLRRISLKLPADECHKTSPIISEHEFM